MGGGGGITSNVSAGMMWVIMSNLAGCLRTVRYCELTNLDLT